MLPSIKSDHSPILMKIKTFDNTKGPGLWKLNKSLLDDEKYVRLIIELINKLKEDEQNYEDKRLWWEYLNIKSVRHHCNVVVLKQKKDEIGTNY
jgi:hypothetical protein